MKIKTKKRLILVRNSFRVFKRANKFTMDNTTIKIFMRMLPFLLITEFSWFFFSLLMGKMTDYATGKNHQMLIMCSVLFFGVLAISSFSELFVRRMQNFFNFNSIKKLEKVFVKKLTYLGYADRNDPKIKDIVDQASNNKRSINDLSTMYRGLIMSLLGLFVTTAIFTYFTWWYGPLILIGAVLRFSFNRSRNVRVYKKDKSLRELRRYGGEINNQATGVYENKVNLSINYFLNLKLNFIDKMELVSLRYANLGFRYNLVISCIQALTFVAITVHFFFQVSYGKHSVGSVILIINSINQFRNSFYRIAETLSDLDNVLRKVKDLFFLLDYKNIITDGSDELQANKGQVSIEFKDVWFKYPNTDIWVIKNLNFKIYSGERIGIVGDNGAGKTTVVHLMLRYYDPQKGSILINGQDLKSIKISSFYKHLGFLLSDFNIFHSSVYNAIWVGDITKTLERSEIIKASINSELDDWVKKQPQGYDQKIGLFYYDGVKLSDGTRQKLAMAKVLYRNPSFIILDEPTSALSPFAEENIFKKYHEICKGKTTIMISHRFKSLEQVERILVLEDGSVIEDGTHSELVNLRGVYRRMFESAKIQVI